MKTTKSKKSQKPQQPKGNQSQQEQKQQPKTQLPKVDFGPVWFYNRKKLALAFEFGLNFAIAAQTNGLNLTSKEVLSAEKIMFKEFRRLSSNEVSGQFQMLLLAALGDAMSSVNNKK